MQTGFYALNESEVDGWFTKSQRGPHLVVVKNTGVETQSLYYKVYCQRSSSRSRKEGGSGTGVSSSGPCDSGPGGSTVECSFL